MTEIKKYYELQEKDKAQYEKFLKRLSQQTTSRELFSTTNGQLESKRRNLHNDIIDEYLKKHNSQEKPYIHFIIGSIGSGKTSLKDTVIEQQKIQPFLYINFDDLKLKLPEYQILKKLNPKKAAHFVQSESAKLAGLLYKKALQKKANIIYEKNLRIGQDNKLHIIEEIKKSFKKNYNISIHVVFLDSYQEAWRRVQLRYEKIKRYVPEKEVKSTFECLFPNLNILLKQNFNQKYLVKFWYNGKWNVNFDMPKEAHIIGLLSFCKNWKFNNQPKDDNFAVIFEGTYCEYDYCGFWLKRVRALPDKAKKNLMQLKGLEHLKHSLNILRF